LFCKLGLGNTGDAIILSDKDKVISVLTNLIKNAIKYTEKGYVEFGYIINDSTIEFYVTDSGIGIESEKQNAIFDRFVQADISLARSYEGAGLGLAISKAYGLGLAISKAYAELIGGKVWVDSQLGMGSTFYFSIPYKKAFTQPATSFQG